MTAEENKGLVLRLATAIDERNLDAIDELVAQDFVDHTAPPDQPPGPEGIKHLVRVFQGAFPAWKTEIEGIIAEGDTVVFWGTGRGVHEGTFMGTPATGRTISIPGIHVIKLRDGLITEHRSYNDQLGTMRQLGASPVAAAP